MQGLHGFIKLHRSLLHWGWYKDPAVKSLFLHILLNASFRQTVWQGRVILPGQMIASYQSLSRDLGLSVQQIRTAVKKLTATGAITHSATNQYTVFTVQNWAQYQAEESESQPREASHAQGVWQAANKQETGKQQHRKNVKNVKKKAVAPLRGETKTDMAEKIAALRR